MTTTYETLAGLNSQALYTEFLQKVIAGFTAIGWNQTADTGQIDPAAVTATAPTTTTRHNLVFESTDDLSATAKIILKLEFAYSGTIYTGTTYLYASVGLATNGAGAFVGASVASLPFGAVSAYGAADFVMSAIEGGGFAWEHAVAAGESRTLVLDRSRDTSGNPTGEYVFVFLSGPSSAVAIGGITFSGSLLTSYNSSSGYRLPHALPDVPDSLVLNGTSPVSPVFPMIGRLGNPMLMAAVCRSADVPLGSTFDLNIYGQTRTYRRRLKNTNGGAGNASALCYLWEP